jgi:inosose dehydratase
MSKAPSEATFKWVAQVITFYAPSFWGFNNDEELLAYAKHKPREFFDRLLDEVRATGVDFVELCMAPGDWKTAAAAYGGGAGLQRAAQAKGLRVSGSYQGGHLIEQALKDAGARAELLEDTKRHAEFLQAAGVDLMMSGPPRRGALLGSAAPRVPDDMIAGIAEILTEMAQIVAACGVRLAIHTESYSCICRNEDIDRIMANTKPGLVFLCPDSGHIALDDGAPTEVVRKHMARIPTMHWKDCIGPRKELPKSGSPTHEMMMEQFCRMGHGMVDWNSIIAAFDAVGFEGYAVAEIDLSEDPGFEVRDVIGYYARHREQALQASARQGRAPQVEAPQ